MKILLIEDNLILSRNITKMLIEDDIHTELATDWIDWLKKALIKYYDIIILDVNLPWIDGFEICKKIREEWKDVWIIMLTSLSSLNDKITWLNNWADDYLTKPFEYDELIARIEAIQRRKMKNSSNTIIKIWELELDLQLVELRNCWKKITLSKIEFDLFKLFAQNKWKALSRNEIYEIIWWESSWEFLHSRTMDVHIWNLRKKLPENTIKTKKWFWFIIE